MAWGDDRNGNGDIYAQRVLANCMLGGDVAGVPATAALAFALDPVHPNPARGSALTVRFALANATAASLDLLDVAGRRLVSHEVGSLGAGSHSLVLGRSTRLAPGLYLVCLRQGADVRTTRVVVLE